MKSSFGWSAAIAILIAAVGTTAFGQGVPGTSGPAPYGGPVAGMPGYGGPEIMPAGMYGASPGMPGPGMSNYPPTLPGPGRISGYGPPPGMMSPGMFGPGMGGDPGMHGMPVGADGMMPDGGPPPELPVGATPWQNPFSAEDTACWDGSCGCCTQCCRPGWLWAELEFLIWWQKGSGFPALVTTSTDPTVTRDDAGVLGVPSTLVLFGDDQFGDDTQFGGRATLGFWFDHEQNTGLGTRYTQLTGDSESFSATSDGSTVLARPFFNALLGQEDALLIGFTDPVDGPIAEGSIISEFDNSFVSSETFLRCMLNRDRNRRLDFLIGYHFLRLDNYFRINSTSTATDPIFSGTTFSLFDRFDTENEFHGATVALDGSYGKGRWSLDWLAKVSFGQMRQTSEIDGALAVTPFGVGPPVPLPGGLFAQTTNIGTRTRYEEVFIPEFNLGLTYHARPNLSLGMSYNYMWISSVLLSGDQIDRQVNLSQQTGPLVGPARPAFAFNDTDYWLMGMNFSLQYNY